MDHNFADNKYIRKAIELKTAENKKYRAKRIKDRCAKNNKKQNYFDYVEYETPHETPNEIPNETPIETPNDTILDEYVVL
jgi:hypothetical protein